MGWSISPDNGLASIDNNGHATFLYHTSDVTYTVRYTSGTCDKTKEVLVHACSTPDVCNCTITPSGSANNLPAETGDTEYEVVTYSSSNCIKSTPDILFIGGTDFLGSFRNENGKTYAKVKLENTDSEVKTGTYLFMISNCRAEVEFTQMAVTPSQSCSILNFGDSSIPKSGGNLRLFAVGCGGKNCMKVESTEKYYSGYGYAYEYKFHIENPETSIDYRQGSFPTITNSNGEDVTHEFEFRLDRDYVIVEAQQSAGVQAGNYTMSYTNTTAGITDCQTEFPVYWDHCRYLNPRIDRTDFPPTTSTVFIHFDFYGYAPVYVTSTNPWFIVQDRTSFYQVVMYDNTTGEDQETDIIVSVNGSVCKTFHLLQHHY